MTATKGQIMVNFDQIKTAALTAAHDVYHNDGWRKVPAQCPVVAEAIKGQDRPTIMEILATWSETYHTECNRLANIELEKIGIT
jgi:hypothetical protein